MSGDDDSTMYLQIIGTVVVGAVMMYFMFAGGDKNAPKQGKSKKARLQPKY